MFAGFIIKFTLIGNSLWSAFSFSCLFFHRCSGWLRYIHREWIDCFFIRVVVNRTSAKLQGHYKSWTTVHFDRFHSFRSHRYIIIARYGEIAHCDSFFIGRTVFFSMRRHWQSNMFCRCKRNSHVDFAAPIKLIRHLCAQTAMKTVDIFEYYHR